MQPSLFAREDTMLGVCQGLGEELGLNPQLFRIAFAVGLFWSLPWSVMTYLTLGVALTLFRWALPFRPATPVQTAAPRSANDDAPAPLAQAA